MSTLHQIIGSGPETIVWWQMVIRGILVFFYTLVSVRFGGRRIFGKWTAFDIVLGVILGSIMSRALTANARFVPTLAAATVLVLLHRALAYLSYHNATIGHFVKGTEVHLVRNGKPVREAMRRARITPHDLQEAMRLNGGIGRTEDIETAYLERSGEISVISH